MEELSKIIVNKRSILGLSQEEVADKTKIRLNIIKLVESGKFDELPPVYGIAFLKSYLKFLNIPESDYISYIETLIKNENQKQNKIINQSINNLKTVSGTESNNFLDIFKFGKSKNIKNSILFYSILAFVILGLCITIYLMFFTFDKPSIPTLTNITGIGKDTTVLGEENKGLLNYFDQSDSLTLEAIAIDTCWIRITVDGKTNEELLMTSNNKKKWYAKEYFIISQGNVGAIQFTRNGRLLDPFGSRGSVVKNVKITKDKVIN